MLTHVTFCVFPKFNFQHVVPIRQHEHIAQLHFLDSLDKEVVTHSCYHNHKLIRRKSDIAVVHDSNIKVHKVWLHCCRFLSIDVAPNNKINLLYSWPDSLHLTDPSTGWEASLSSCVWAQRPGDHTTRGHSWDHRDAWLVWAGLWWTCGRCGSCSSNLRKWRWEIITNFKRTTRHYFIVKSIFNCRLKLILLIQRLECHSFDLDLDLCLSLQHRVESWHRFILFASYQWIKKTQFFLCGW